MRGGFGRRISSGQEIDYDIKNLDRRLLSFLMDYVKPHRRQLLLCFAAVIGTTITTLLGPYLIKVGVDDYLMAGRFQGLSLVAGLMVGNYLIFLVLFLLAALSGREHGGEGCKPDQK